MNRTTRLGRRTLVILIAVMVTAAVLAGRAGGPAGDVPVANAETVACEPTDDAPLPEDVQNELDSALTGAMNQYQVPGAVVMLATPEGTWVAEQGVADLDTQEPVSAEMVWPLRSLTKSVVVTVLLQLVDEGALALDDTIDTYVSDVPNGDVITLLDLAAMTSGVGDYTRSDAFVQSLMDDPDQQYTLAELNRFGLAEGSQFQPGTKHVYSNTSTNLLGVVIEQVTGQPIAHVVQDRIAEELNLPDTTYPTSDADWAEPHPQGYQPGEFEPEPMFNNFSAMGASGAMISTLSDMTVWAEALGTGALISPELQDERLVGAPLSEGPEYDQYAVGIGEVEGWWGHTGEGLGFTSLAMYDPDTCSTTVIFMNISQAVERSADGDGEQRHVPTVLMREIADLLNT